jgi:hypothetical protein
MEGGFIVHFQEHYVVTVFPRRPESQKVVANPVFRGGKDPGEGKDGAKGGDPQADEQ